MFSTSFSVARRKQSHLAAPARIGPPDPPERYLHEIAFANFYIREPRGRAHRSRAASTKRSVNVRSSSTAPVKPHHFLEIRRSIAGTGADIEDAPAMGDARRGASNPSPRCARRDAAGRAVRLRRRAYPARNRSHLRCCSQPRIMPRLPDRAHRKIAGARSGIRCLNIVAARPEGLRLGYQRDGTFSPHRDDVSRSRRPRRELRRHLLRRVRTTGIFCRPTCPAKKPARENVDFFATPADALHGGYRPCLRCQPMDPDKRPPN